MFELRRHGYGSRKAYFAQPCSNLKLGHFGFFVERQVLSAAGPSNLLTAVNSRNLQHLTVTDVERDAAEHSVSAWPPLCGVLLQQIQDE